MAPKKDAVRESDAWIPTEPGQELTGVVVDIDSGWSDLRAGKDASDPEAGWYPLISIEQADGEVVKLHAFKTVLYNEVMRRQPQVGETVTVVYVGPSDKEPAKGMSPAEIYRVRVEGRAASPAAYAGFRPARGPGAVSAAAAAAAEPASDVTPPAVELPPVDEDGDPIGF